MKDDAYMPRRAASVSDVEPGRTEELRVLMVEDAEDDEALVLGAFRRAAVRVKHRRVCTKDDLRAALRQETYDLVLSDFSLPGFDAYDVLRIVSELTVDTPALVVSGTLAEEDTAVSLLRAGAKDFVLKDRLARLAPAATREVSEARGRARQRQMREQLLISDRMASIGMLAAGVAHEINNPVNVLGLTIHLLERELGAREDVSPIVRTVLTDAREAVRRVSQIARDITTFARSDSGTNTEPVELPRVIASSLRMAKHHITYSARVIEEIAPVPAVRASEGRLGQLFLNLLVNAAQAIAPGKPEDNEIRITVRALDASWVEVGIADSGCGISPEHLERIFDPFFTTKPAGVGTGLGLPICKQIVSDLGGEIEVESVVGRGTTIRIRLPVHESSRVA